MEGLKSFVLYTDINEYLDELTNEDAGILFKAIVDYAETGECPEINGIVKVAFIQIKKAIDYNAAKYEETRKKRAESGKRGAEARWQTDGKAMANDGKAMANHSKAIANDGKAMANDSKGMANDGLTVNCNMNTVSPYGDSIGDTHQREERARRFTAPTVEDVRQYAQEKGYRVNAEKFCDYYASNGWKVGKNPMKDWRAAVRNWVRQEDRYGNSNSPQRETEQGTTREAWRKVRIVQG